ncbi:MAG: hypothetical protein B6I19_01110 [Bacteroidetes bacterium 4572_114]|nr:MAG: hypothetical protein B6I19_01110 [Bacteroidetes bacterium 4572_114]
MNNQQVEIPLNKSQLEILKLFRRELDEDDLLEIKRLIVRYLGEKITKMADHVWAEKNWKQEDMEKLLNSHSRTPYNPLNQ